MGLLVKGAEVTEKATKTGAKVVSKGAKKHPIVATGIAAYSIGSLHSSLAGKHPEMYDQTPNKGRSEDRHPNSGYYG